MERQVRDGKLSQARFKDYWNGLNRFFKILLMNYSGIRASLGT